MRNAFSRTVAAGLILTISWAAASPRRAGGRLQRAATTSGAHFAQQALCPPDALASVHPYFSVLRIGIISLALALGPSAILQGQTRDVSSEIAVDSRPGKDVMPWIQGLMADGYPTRRASAEALSRIAHTQRLTKFVLDQLNARAKHKKPYDAQLMRLLKDSEDLHIDFPFRFDRHTLQEIIDVRKGRLATGRPLAVLLFLKEDYDSAFYNTSFVRDQLIPRYNVTYVEIEPIHRGLSGQIENPLINFSRAFETATKQERASLVILGAHGSPASMTFGMPSRSEDPVALNLKSERDLRDLGLGKRMTREAKAILFSCQTGSERNGVENFEQMMARVWEHPTLGARSETGEINLVFNHDDLVGVAFYDGTLHSTQIRMFPVPEASTVSRNADRRRDKKAQKNADRLSAAA